MFLTFISFFKYRASVFEEEDFQPLVYGFRLCADISEQKALGAIRESEEEVLKEIKNITPNDSVADSSTELKVVHYLNDEE